jgi:hypothetical protein
MLMLHSIILNFIYYLICLVHCDFLSSLEVEINSGARIKAFISNFIYIFYAFASFFLN